MAEGDVGIDVQEAGLRPLLWEELLPHIPPAEKDEIERVVGSAVLARNEVRPPNPATCSGFRG